MAKDNKKVTFSKRVVKKYKELGKTTRIAIWSVFVLGLLCSIAIPVILIFKLDSIIFPSSLDGQVYDYENISIEEARVCIGNKCTNTDSNGEFSLANLTYGKNTIEISQQGYETATMIVNLKRGANFKEFEMQIAGRRDFIGVLNLEKNKGKVVEDDLILNLGENSEPIIVGDDGSFEVKNVEITTERVKIQSPNYKDIEVEVDVSQLVIDLGTRTLEVAGDITFDCTDWLSQIVIEDLKISGTINEEEIETINYEQRQAECYIKDLELKDRASLQVVKDGYITKNIEVGSVEQGKNFQEDLQMVREGKLVYTSNRTGNEQIYIANYDGSEEQLLTGNTGRNYSPYFDEANNVVYFLSNRDGKKDDDGDIVDLVYKVDVLTKKITKISSNEYNDNDGNIGAYNLRAGKRAFVKEHPDYPDTYQMWFGNIDGTGNKQLAHTSENESTYFYSISDDGKYVLFQGYYPDSSRNGLYLMNTTNLDKDRIYEPNNEENKYGEIIEFSSDGKMAMIRERTPQGSDLFIRIFNKGELIKITNTASYEYSPRFSDNSEFVSFVSNRDNKSDIYVVDLSNKEETKITSNGKVDNAFWRDGLLFFSKEDDLWVIDPQNPENERLVTRDSLVSNYYSYYYWD
ncbi:carboxypeptidase-like regulatory domain-containing protein [Candidatus Dojkabacteria bacterium]|nr:carboxypeptidase-like regulatory domain-containing protein [Candidatus Dojkabacteria bacterium]